MKLTIEQGVLSRAVNRNQGTISERSLSHIGIKATKDGLVKIAASDHVLAVYSQLDAKVTTEGVIFVPGRLFSDVVKELPEGTVNLETKQAHLVITAGANNEFSMKIPLVEDLVWKEPKAIQSSNVADIPAAKLNYLIDQVQFCIAYESARNYGAVGYIHKPEDGKLRLVGTDGFRLSFCDLQISLPEQFLKTGVCLSKRAIVELQRMCNEGFENIRLVISDDQTTLVAMAPGYEIYMRLAAVKYPNYLGVLPTANLSPVKLSRPHVQHVAKRVMLAADKTRSIRLSFGDSLLTLSSRSAGNSEGKESLRLNDYKGATRELSINGKFLTDVFSAISSEDITLQFRGEDDPIVIMPQFEPQSCRSMHVLVPIREQ